MMNHEKYISFKGITITRCDRKLLEGPFFLNDAIIEFYFRFLELSYGEEDILLVSPAISFWLANSADAQGVKKTAESLKIHEKQLVLFTINDEGNQDESNGGGLHWSLLVYYRRFNYFLHHDSVKGFNNCEARMLYMAVKDHVNVPKHTHNNSDDNDDDDDDDGDLTRPIIGLRGPKHKMREAKKKERLRVEEEEEEEEACFQECITPQQSNLYDCGLYVMKMSAVICEWYLSRKLNLTTDPLWVTTVREKVMPCYVQEEMRTDILKLIDLLKQEGY